MARNEQLVRQLKLLQLLEESRYGLTLDELNRGLVDRLGLAALSDRTVRRDLEALQAAGFDVDAHGTPRGTVWKLGQSLRSVPKIAATCTELLALSLGRELLAPLAGTPFAQGLDTLWDKIRGALPPPVWRHFDKRRRKVLVLGAPLKSYSAKAGILATLNQAVLQRRVVEIEYQPIGAKEPRPREIEPYTLAVYQGSVYAVAALCGASAEEPLRHLKLDRFRKARLLDRRFKPRAFDGQRHFANSVGVYKDERPVTIRVRFSPRVTPWITETPWHAQQRVDVQDEGGAIVTFPAVYEREILPRILALGAEAEILEPASARAAARASLEAAARPYRGRRARGRRP